MSVAPGIIIIVIIIIIIIIIIKYINNLTKAQTGKVYLEIN